MRSRLIACSLALLPGWGCRGAEPKLPESFDSNVLKISWFRFGLPLNIVPAGGQKFQAVKFGGGWDARWSGIFSYSWLRQRGPKAEEYLKHVPNVRVAFDPKGLPDTDVRGFVDSLFRDWRLLEIPPSDPSLLTKDWFDRFLKLPSTRENMRDELGYVKLIVVESDKGRRLISLYDHRGRATFEAVRKLSAEISRLMTIFAPEAGGATLDSPGAAVAFECEGKGGTLHPKRQILIAACPECGAGYRFAMSEGRFHCIDCRKELPAQALVCAECGASPSPPPRLKSR